MSLSLQGCHWEKVTSSEKCVRGMKVCLVDVDHDKRRQFSAAWHWSERGEHDNWARRHNVVASVARDQVVMVCWHLLHSGHRLPQWHTPELLWRWPLTHLSLSLIWCCVCWQSDCHNNSAPEKAECCQDQIAGLPATKSLLKKYSCNTTAISWLSRPNDTINCQYLLLFILHCSQSHKLSQHRHEMSVASLNSQL